MRNKAVLKMGRGLDLPIDAVTATLAIMGIRDSGKTNTAVVFVEEALDAGQQCVVIDPTDVWWGLKSSKDGKSAGYPIVILGGKKADLPLFANDGKTIADFIVDNPSVSVVISTRHFESQNAERHFVTELLRRLYYRKGQQGEPTPLTVVFDEASRTVPQRVTGDVAPCVGAVQQIVRQGRSSGFGVVLIDQRPATVNKDVLAMLEMLVMHRVTSPHDRKALTAWIEQHDSEERGDAFLGSLAGQKQGEAWIWSPLLDLFQQVKIRERRTFDSSYTPKIGQRRAKATKIAEIDLDDLKAKLASTVEKAREDDPKTLRNELSKALHKIRGLEADAGKGTASKDEIDRAYVRGREDEARDIWQRVYDRMRPIFGLVDLLRTESHESHQRVDQVANLLRTVDGELTKAMSAKPGKRAVAVTVSRHELPSTKKVAARQTPTPSKRMADSMQSATQSDIGRTPQLMLNALLFCESIGQESAHKNTIRAIVGINKTTSLDTYMTRLRGWQLIEGGDVVHLTDAGRVRASNDGLPTSLTELHEKIIGQLGNSEGTILQTLLDEHPGGITRERLKARAGDRFTDSSFDTYLTRLRSPGFIENRGDMIFAAEFLFPAGFR